MEHKLEIYRDLATLFDSKGFLLYLVGGTVRDYLLGKELTDMDLVTDATPSEMKEFLSNADYTFEKYGSVRLKIDDIKFDITTLRK
jgi:tRNA nucleotidyltransferase/poly(A) polymerase